MATTLLPKFFRWENGLMEIYDVTSMKEDQSIITKNVQILITISPKSFGGYGQPVGKIFCLQLKMPVLFYPIRLLKSR